MLSERALLRLEDIDALISHNECVNAASEIRSLRAKVEAVRKMFEGRVGISPVNFGIKEAILAILDAKD